MMWWLYVGPCLDEQHSKDLARMQGLSVKATVIGMGYNTVRMVVRHLSDVNCAGLVLPDDFRRHHTLLEDVKACAHHMGLKVMPLTRFLNETKPATASAVPANQHHAVVG